MVTALASVLGALTLAPTAVAHGRHHQRSFAWHTTTVDATQSFRGLAAVDSRTAWVAGQSLTDGGPGTVYRTTDGGRHWRDVSPPDTDGLAFRDVEALGRDGAAVLAIGEGTASRIYRTYDGGRHWTQAFTNADPAAFYDCLSFYPGGKVGLAVSDPVDGKFQIARSVDGGRSWHVLPGDGMPSAEGQFGFAASGDCLVTAGHDAWFGGGGTAAQIFHSTDLGRTWRATDSTIAPGDAAGVFGLAFRAGRHERGRQGIAVGGDFSNPTNGTDAVARTLDGRSWHKVGSLTHLGEAAAWLPGTRDSVLVTGESGTTMGTSLSRDGGHTWTLVSTTGFHALTCTRDGVCWAAGGNGRVGRG
ncbi:oxidoreductase [Nocardioides mangrovicus]|uniref:Oxidoreductase n=1 Tax=Nocardioides mangrovicus TaxID=2478913 RepID=A0A3L8P1X1_9ACTN|nr:oxidoreductase [Nocardioides mangrovicus]